MSKKTTNLLGIIIAIIAGTYFYITLCSECSSRQEDPSSETTISNTGKQQFIETAKEKPKSTLIN